MTDFPFETLTACFYNNNMHRRDFILLSSAALCASARKLWADHHVISADPLVVEFDLGSLAGQYTSVEDFYVRNHYAAPEMAGTVSLRIDGEVDKPRQLTLEDLRRMPQQETGAVMECAGDPVRTLSLVSDGLWRGWRLREVLSLARPRRNGIYVHLSGADGFARSVPIARAMQDGILATHLNGHPLIRNHGAPWRAVFPGWYGMDSVKWLKAITIAESPLPPVGNTYLQLRQGAGGVLERRPLPSIQVKSVITNPADGSVLRPGKTQIRGLAWSGAGKVSAVQVSANGGVSWRAGIVNHAGSRYDWAFWRATAELTEPGAVELVCRATDDQGNTQPLRREPGRIDYYAYNVCEHIRCVVV